MLAFIHALQQLTTVPQEDPCPLPQPPVQRLPYASALPAKVSPLSEMSHFPGLLWSLASAITSPERPVPPSGQPLPSRQLSCRKHCPHCSLMHLPPSRKCASLITGAELFIFVYLVLSAGLGHDGGPGNVR